MFEQTKASLPASRRFRALALIVSTAISAISVEAMAWESVLRVTSPAGGYWQVFGRHVAASGDVAVIAEPEWGLYDPAGPGTAYVYRYDSDQEAWGLESQLDPWGPDDGHKFGDAISMDGDVIAVGAWGWADEEGRVFVFRYDHDSSTWAQEQILDPDPPGYIGNAVDVWGDTIITDGTSGGLVFRYDNDTSSWFEEQELIPDSDYRFVSDASIEGDRAVVGYRGYNSGRGAAMVFDYDSQTSSWVQSAVLTHPDAEEQDRFGISVAVAGDLIAAGAYQAGGRGMVFVFHLLGDVWEQVAQVEAPQGWGDFGYDIAFDGQTLLVGHADFYWNLRRSPSGAAHVYSVDPDTYEITPVDLLGPTTDDAGDFGISVAFSGSHFVVGDYSDMELDEYAGAAYFFEVVLNDCPADVNADEEVNIDDLFQVLSAWGPCYQCPEDINEDAVVDIDDVFAVLAAWGPC